MAFPSSPINGQITVVNNVTYTYESAVTAWTRTAPTSANTITTDTANVTSNISSTSTTTGALKVAGGVGIVGNVYAGNFFYANGSVLSGGLGYTGSAGAGYTGSQGAAGSGYINLSMVGAISPPFTGTARFYSPTDVTINTVYANLSSAPTGGNLNFILKKNGVSIGTTFVLSTALMTPVSVNISLVTTDYLTMDVSGVAASDLYVRLKYV